MNAVHAGYRVHWRTPTDTSRSHAVLAQWRDRLLEAGLAQTIEDVINRSLIVEEPFHDTLNEG